MAILKTDPFFIDINLISSTDLQANVTDYVSLLNNFIDECVVNNTYWHTDSHSDPITSKVEFYKLLNKEGVPVKDSPEGAKKRDISTKKIIAQNYQDQLNDNVILKSTNGGDVEMDSPTVVNGSITTTKREWVTSGEDIGVQTVGEWKTEVITTGVKKEVEQILEIQKTPPEYQDNLSMSDMSPWFVLWWMEKFYTAHDVVKKDLRELLGDENEYFVNFSDSVGQLKNIQDTRDTTTLPVWDINVDAFGEEHSIPTTTPGVGKYCMQPESLALCDQLSKHTNKKYRKNISKLMEDPSRDEIITGIMPSFSTDSHGNNLVNDYMHPNRLTSFVDTIRDVIQEHLKGLYDVLELLSDRENYMVVNKPKQILMKVEDFTVSVDLLKNAIKSYDTPKTQGTQPRYGKAYKFNQINTNDSVLKI